MKRTKQRILCLFLSVCMVITCMIGLSVTASAVDTTISRTDVELLLINFLSLEAEYANDSETTLALTNAYNSLSDAFDRALYQVDDAVISEYINAKAVYDLYANVSSTSHTHAWTYSAGTDSNANVITANCDEGCDITTAPTITVTAPALTQEGGTESAEATLTKNETWTADNGFAADPTISYFSATTEGAATGGTALPAAPTTAGTYYAQITVGDAVAAVPYTIAPVPVYTVNYEHGEYFTGSTVTLNDQTSPYTLLSVYDVADTGAWMADRTMGFLGWDVNGTVYNQGDEITLTGETTATALWEIPVLELSLDQDAAIVAEGGSVKLTATISPDDAENKKVKWAVDYGEESVALYSDEDCTVPVGDYETDVLEVYVKGLPDGRISSVTVTSCDRPSLSAECYIAVAPSVILSGASNSTLYLTIVETGEKTTSPQLSNPAAIGFLLRDAYEKMTLSYTANDGYAFEKFEPVTVNGVTAEWVNSKTVTLSGVPEGDTELVIPDAVAATGAFNTTEIFAADFDEYDPRTALTADLFPGFTPVTANEAANWTGAPAEGDCELIFDLNGREYVFALYSDGKFVNTGIFVNVDDVEYYLNGLGARVFYTGTKPGHELDIEDIYRYDTPIGADIDGVPNYTGNGGAGSSSATPASATPDAEPDDGIAPGTFFDITDADSNVGFARITDDIKFLYDAVVTDEDYKALKAGKDIKVWLTVKTIGLSPEEQAAVQEAADEVEGIGDVLLLDIEFFKQIGDGEAVNIHSLNDDVAITLQLPESFINMNSGVYRTFFVMRLHEGELAYLDCLYDAESNTITFYTDSFSAYIITCIDTDLTEGTIDADDDDDDDDDEIEIDDGFIEPIEENPQVGAVDAAGETNPHTGTELPAFAVLAVSVAAAALTLKKRHK